MDPYILPQREIPECLFRVQYPSSWTKFSEDGSLEAANTTTIYAANEEWQFKTAVERHFTWHHPLNKHLPSPFISLFSDFSFAYNWARLEPWRGQRGRFDPKGEWKIHVIDTDNLGSACFRLRDLVKADELNVNIPGGASGHIEGAFICLHRIPEAAIIESLDPERALQCRSCIQSS